VNLAPVTYGTRIWLDGEASVRYVQATQIPLQAVDLYTLLSEHYSMALLDRVHDAGRVITLIDNKFNLLRKEVQKLKEGGNPEAVAAAERRATEAQALIENLQAELEEAARQWESMEKELSRARVKLVDLQKQLSDAQGQLIEVLERLEDSEDQLRNSRTKVREMEIELL
ncbi:hypothetical protein BHM03_00026875, partial [Ensete ventricosum]